MEVSLESYEFEYEIFLAESELFTKMVCFGSDILNESSGLVFIHENMKETILTYIKKISDAIQKAWDRFKELCMSEKDSIYLKSIAKKMENPNPAFTITNFPTYDMMKLDSIKLIPFNYEDMKDSLKTKESFISKYYNGIIADSKKSISENIESLIVTSRKDTKCTPEILKDLYKFCATEFKSKVTSIENDLKTVNDSNKNIERLVSMASPSESTTEAVAIYESGFILEAEDDKESNKMSFQDEKPSGEEGQGKTELVKNINAYMKVTTDVLSAKLKVYKDIRNTYMQVIKHYISGKDNSSTEESEEKDNSSASQVNI